MTITANDETETETATNTANGVKRTVTAIAIMANTAARRSVIAVIVWFDETIAKTA